MELKSCPFCGGASGYSNKEIVSYELYFTFDGESNGYSDPSGLKVGKRYKCIDCGKTLNKYLFNEVE